MVARRDTIKEIKDYLNETHLNALQKAIILEEVRSQLYQRDYFKPLGSEPIDYSKFVPKCYVAKQDKAKLAAIFVEGGPTFGKVYLHLVFTDEYCPIPVVDEVYRKVREIWFGRHADVESVEVSPPVVGPIVLPIPYFSTVKFPTTWSGYFQPYFTSVHHSATEPWCRTLYSNTWNHLMTAGPSPMHLLVNYREEKPEVYIGSRADAEKYARKL
jgi:hypothetical protein